MKTQPEVQGVGGEGLAGRPKYSSAQSPAQITANPPERILGLDFSGALDAGRHIWLTEAVRDGERLRLSACRRGADLPGSAVEREPCLAALRAYLGGLERFAIGMDFPFSLHRSLMPEGSLAAFVAGFQRRWLAPEAFRAACRISGSDRELRRHCDNLARTPFVPHNLRLFRQTWHGIAQLLAPLQAAGAHILPGHPPSSEPPTGKEPWLLETCPASALKAIGLTLPYKGNRPKHRATRDLICDHLLDDSLGHGIVLGEGVSKALLLDDEGGDALDSVICAWIAWRAVRDPVKLFPSLPPGREMEGWVYF